MAAFEAQLSLRATIDYLLEMMERTNLPNENLLAQALAQRAARLPEVPRAERIFWLNLPRAGIVFSMTGMAPSNAFGVDWQEPNRSFHVWRYLYRGGAEIRASYEYYGGRFNGVVEWYLRQRRVRQEIRLVRVDEQFRRGLLTRLTDTDNQPSHWDVGICLELERKLEAFA